VHLGLNGGGGHPPGRRIVGQPRAAVERLRHRPAQLGSDQLQRLVPGRGREEPVHRSGGREHPARTLGVQQPGGRRLAPVIYLQADVRTAADSLALHLVQGPRDIEHHCVSFVQSHGAVALPEQATRWGHQRPRPLGPSCAEVSCEA
jgi:hypothetical protein